MTDDRARPPHRGLVRRFKVPTRLVHWSLSVFFILLLLTGLTNFVPELKTIHIGGARLFAWAHVALGFANGPDDTRWLRHQLARLIRRGGSEPPVAKFNAGQKLNALLSAAATAGLLGTGVILGINYITKRVFSTVFVADVFPLHTWLALAFIPVLLGHLYLALINPSTREALRGMTSGSVRRDWARRHHPGWTPGED